MLAARVKKRMKALRPRFDRDGVTAFRVYDRDIPEVRAVVDWFAGHAVVGEYERAQTEAAGDWLGTMGAAVAEALALPPDHVHLKRRRTRTPGLAGGRYAEASHAPLPPESVGVREGPLRFRVRLDGRLDVGLFTDQRLNRKAVRDHAEGCAVLNLFAYTGGFSVAALSGGAKHVTSVDTSRTYLDWAQENLRENDLPLERHEPARKEAFEFLRAAARGGRRWHLILADPPSFSTTGGPSGRGLDIRRDHPALLEACLDVLAPGGTLVFTTHHQRFAPRFEGRLAGALETTDQTVPEDYRNRTIHRSFRWRVR